MDKQRVLEALAYLLVIVVILTLPLTLKAVLATEVPLAVVKSTSMTPTLNVGDIVIIVGIKPSEIHVGDIIIYNERIMVQSFRDIHRYKPVKMDYIIIHRVVEVYHDPKTGKYYFITKGDNNAIRDPWIVPEDGILGKAVTVKLNGVEYIVKIPYIGFLSLYVHR